MSQLNPDAVKDILLCVENRTDKTYYNHGVLLKDVYSKTKCSKDDIEYALKQILKTSLLDLIEPPSFLPDGRLKMAKISGLSWEGHDFLNSIKDDTKWGTIKKNAVQMGKRSLKGLMSVAKGVAIATVSNPAAMDSIMNTAKAMDKIF